MLNLQHNFRIDSQFLAILSHFRAEFPHFISMHFLSLIHSDNYIEVKVVYIPCLLLVLCIVIPEGSVAHFLD